MSTGPEVKSALQTRTPPATRDFIALQSLLLRAQVDDPTLEAGRHSAFRVDGSEETRFTRYNTAAGPDSTEALFTAWTTDRSMLFESAVWTSMASHPVATRESVIHVLRLPP